MVDKRQLLGMTLEELKGVASEVGLPAYAAKQMADWIYKKKITRISEMTNIAVANELLVLYDGKTRLHGKPDSEPDIEPDPVFAGKRFIDEYRFHGNGGATG